MCIKCDIAEETTIKHYCDGNLPHDMCGAAIDYCIVLKDGTFWVRNGAYTSQVNYCPYCGGKAPVQVNPERPNK